MVTEDAGMLITDLIHKTGSATLIDSALGPARGLAYDVRSGRQTLTDEQERKLRVLHEVQADVSGVRTNANANRWLIAGNDLLSGISPLTAIREGLYEAVRDAARAFIDRDVG